MIVYRQKNNLVKNFIKNIHELTCNACDLRMHIAALNKLSNSKQHSNTRIYLYSFIKLIELAETPAGNCSGVFTRLILEAILGSFPPTSQLHARSLGICKWLCVCSILNHQPSIGVAAQTIPHQYV